MDYQQTKQDGKGLKYAKMYFCFSLVTCIFLCSCRTNPPPAISYTAIEHSAEIARIETAVTHYGDTVDTFVRDLQQRAASTGNSLDELSILMAEYFEGVGILLQRYKCLQRYVEQRAYLKQDFDQDINCPHNLANSSDSG